jgi:RNA polymerase sigma factor (sigma-70 family)
MRTVSPLEEVVARQDDFVRHVHGHFFRTLSNAACADAVQDAFISASQSEDFGQLEPDQRSAWVRTRAYRNAVDQVRLINGRPDRYEVTGGDVISLDSVPLDTLPGSPDAPEEDPRDDDAAAVLEAYNRLPQTEQRVIGLRHLDNLDRSACARLLGLSETQYKRKHTEAVRRLINLVIQTRPHDTCLQARTLIDLSVNDALDNDSLARRDAHLAGCPHCRQYQRRSRGLLIFLPLPALAFSDRFAARLHGLLERIMPVAQGADPTAAASGAGALGVGGVKIAAIVATGAAAVGGGTAVVHKTSGHHHAKAHAAKVIQSTPIAVAPAATGSAAGQRVGAGTAPPATSTKTKPKAKKANASASSTGELKPLGHEVPVPATSTTASVAASPPAAAATTTSSHQSQHAPVAVPTEAPADSSSGEFAPHP